MSSLHNETIIIASSIASTEKIQIATYRTDPHGYIQVKIRSRKTYFLLNCLELPPLIVEIVFFLLLFRLRCHVRTAV
jgi:hypothetical protein